MATAITNHEELAVQRLRQFLKDRTTHPALVRAISRPMNAVDAALIQLLDERAVDTAIGAQLDTIGKLVGRSRASIDATLSDADYRRYLRAQIWTYQSDGVAFDIHRVMRAVIDDAGAGLELEPQYPASFVYRVNDVAVTDAISDIAAEFLRDATAAGVRSILETSADVPGEMFTFATFTQLDGLHALGSTTLTVDDTSAFPASGTLTLDAALAVEEDVTYTGKTATTFTGVSSTANAHSDNAAVQLATGPGKGFDDEASPGAGGKFATAKES